MKKTKPENAADIDFVITWVDGKDPSWQKERTECSQAYQELSLKEEAAFARIRRTYGYPDDISCSSDKESPCCQNLLRQPAYSASNYTSEARYRDWDNLQYWFRAVERHAPWVRKIFFVTWGHIPAWLNTSHTKLQIIRHKDFIPAQFLPTFNTNAIELNLHRIPDLSEHFVYFNDDTFLIRDTAPDDFFRNGLPCDSAVLSPYFIYANGNASIETNNIELINHYFTTSAIRAHRKKWITSVNGYRSLLTLFYMRKHTLAGVLEPHLPISFLRTSFEEVWQCEPERLSETCSHRFRTQTDYSDWLIRQWQLFSGNFTPRKFNFGQVFYFPQDTDKALAAIRNPETFRLICLNDTPALKDFDKTKDTVNKALQERYPDKSSFEL